MEQGQAVVPSQSLGRSKWGSWWGTESGQCVPLCLHCHPWGGLALPTLTAWGQEELRHWAVQG